MTLAEPPVRNTATPTVDPLAAAIADVEGYPEVAPQPEEVSEVEGVEDVAVDLHEKVVTVRGRDLSDEKLRAAIRDAGYEAA